MPDIPPWLLQWEASRLNLSFCHPFPDHSHRARGLAQTVVVSPHRINAQAIGTPRERTLLTAKGGHGVDA